MQQIPRLDRHALHLNRYTDSYDPEVSMTGNRAAREILKAHRSDFRDIPNRAVTDQTDSAQSCEGRCHHLTTVRGVVGMWADFLKSHERRFRRVGNSFIETDKHAPVGGCFCHCLDMSGNGVTDSSSKFGKQTADLVRCEPFAARPYSQQFHGI